MRSVYAVASRVAGGIPARSYSLIVTTSTGPVAASGAVDAGDEPGDCTITWCNSPPAASDSAAHGIVVAPFNPPTLEPGYKIIGTIVAPALGDAWISATAWYEFVSTGTR